MANPSGPGPGAAAGAKLDRPGPAGQAGRLLFGLGFAWTLTTPGEPAADPVVATLPLAILSAGSCAILTDAILRRGQAAGPGWLLMLAPVALGGFPATPESLRFASMFASAVAAGLGACAISRDSGGAPAIARVVLALAAILALQGVAETAFQRGEVREAAREQGEDAFGGPLTPRGWAHVESNRAAVSFINANTFAGFLLLAIPLALAGAFRGGSGVSLSGILLTAILLAGFAAARSAGALLALLASAAIFAPARRLRLLAAGICAAGALLVALGLAGAAPEPVAHKIASFRERLDFNAHALRLLPSMPASGHGFDAFRDLSLGVARPGEAWSAWVHNTPLQLLLETGPGILFLAAGLAAFLRSVRKGPAAAAAAGAGAPAAGRGFLFAGACAGAALAPLSSRSATLLPLHIEQPLLDSLIALGLSILLLRLSGPSIRPGEATAPGPVRPAGVLPALAAFGLHAFLDFDIYAPGVAITVAALCGAVCIPARGCRWAGPLAAAFALAATPVSVHLAIQREEARELAQAAAPIPAAPEGQARDPDRAFAALLSMRPLPIHEIHRSRVLDALDPRRSAKAREFLAALDSLAPSLERRTLARILRARAESQAGWSPEEAARAAARIEFSPGEPFERAFLLYRSGLLERAGDRAGAERDRRRMEAIDRP